MKQCISRVKTFFVHLWQTLKRYVCRKRTAKNLVSEEQIKAIKIMCARRKRNK